MADDVHSFLNAVERDACYRVDVVLKDSALERTERVYFVGINGAEQGPYVRKRFDAEARIGSVYERLFEAEAAGQRFLHLPRVHDYYDLGREHVAVMEFVAGETLADVVCRCGGSAALARDLFPRLCDAVAELHERFDPPVIHRDLKPSNVIVTADSLTLIDFGIARTYREGADEDTRHFGTRAYAPPEQFGFGQTDVRSDVYALGMLLYYCLAAETPTPRVREEGFAKLASLPALRAVVLQATEFDPRGRFASAQELKGAFLQALGTGVDCRTCRTAAGKSSRRTRPSRRAQPSKGVVIARSVIAVLYLAFWVYACALGMVDPNIQAPLLAGGMSQRAVVAEYAVMALSGIPIAWAICDRQALGWRFARIPRWLVSLKAIPCAAIGVGVLFLSGLVGLAL